MGNGSPAESTAARRLRVLESTLWKDPRDQPAARECSAQSAPLHQGPFITAAIKRNAQQYPNQVATIDTASGRTRTYAETEQRIARLAGGFRAQGLAEGGRVAMIMFNSDRFYELFYACAWAGGCCVPVNIRLAPPEMVAIIQDCGATHVVVDDTFAKPVIPALAKAGVSVRFIFAGEGKCPEVATPYESLIQQNGAVEDAMRGGTDTFGIFYTGGTTGKPKGVELTHGNIFANAAGQGGDMGWEMETRYLHSAPMFHLADCSSTFGVTMRAGTHVFIPAFDPANTLRTFASHRITHAMLVPVMMTMVLAVPDIGKHDLSSLKNIIYGASPMASSLLLKMMAAFPNASFMQGYGMTETSPAISQLPAEYHVKDGPKLGSIGRPVSWVEVKVVDHNDVEVPRGTVGEIITRGPHVMKGYWNMPEQTAEALRGGWMHTGDGAKMDEDGFLWIMDRVKDMIITGGENVYSAEVEGVLMGFEPIAQVAIIGTPDQRMGELVTAVVVAKPGKGAECTEDAIKSFCKQRIAGYKCPRKVFVREALPISGAGKVLKHEIRKEFWKGHELSRTYAKDGKQTRYS